MPFTSEQFFEVMSKYNLSVWPAQIFLNLLAIIVVALAIRQTKLNGKIISAILGFFWLWIGAVYHLTFFTAINPAAYIFGALFIFEGFLLLYFGTFKSMIEFKIGTDLFGSIGIIFILYALIIYPVLGYFMGHVYPSNPTFGLPCPTTIFTFGILLFAKTKVPWYLILIPFLWSLIGTSAAINLHVWEDLGLVAAGIIGFSLILMNNKKIKQNKA